MVFLYVMVMNILKMCACVSMVCACAFGANRRVSTSDCVNMVYDQAAGRVRGICSMMKNSGVEWCGKLEEITKNAVEGPRTTVVNFMKRSSKVRDIDNDEKKVIVVLLEVMEGLANSSAGNTASEWGSWEYGVVNGFAKSMQVVIGEENAVESGVVENLWEEAMWRIYADMIDRIMLLVERANDNREGLSDDGKAKIWQNIVKCLKCVLEKCKVKEMQEEIAEFKEKEFSEIKAPGEWRMILQTDGTMARNNMQYWNAFCGKIYGMAVGICICNEKL